MPVKIRKEHTIGNDIFNSEDRVKVVTINCVGAMGKGVAESAKRRHPVLYQRYRALCSNKAQHLNHVWDWVSESGEVIIMFPTKDHYKDKSILPIILDNISILKKLCIVKGYESFSCTGFGMGNGWLDNREAAFVITRFIETFDDDKVKATMYLPEKILVQYKRDLGYI